MCAWDVGSLHIGHIALRRNSHSNYLHVERGEQTQLSAIRNFFCSGSLILFIFVGVGRAR